MKRRLFRVSLTVLAVCLLFASCESRSFIRTVDSLLTPPLYYTEYEGLVDTFNSTIGNSTVLCNPTDGEHKSAITVFDIDGDEAEEAVIFYRNTIDETTAGFALFDNKDGTWVNIGKFSGYGNEVNSLTFDDFDGDGVKEIVVVWYFSGITNANVCTVYRSNLSGKFSEVSNNSCDIVYVTDMDGDSVSEIFMITTVNDGTNVTKTACLTKWTGEEFEQIGSAPVDPNTGGYVSVLTESGDDRYPVKLFIDAIKNNNTMITELIYWNKEDGTLAAPLYDPESNANNLSLRYEQINSVDINADGKIEIPTQTISSDDVDGSAVYVTDWVCFDGTELQKEAKTFVNVEEDYYIDVSSLGDIKAGVRTIEGDGWSGWIFYTENGYSLGGTTLMTILHVPEEKSSGGKYSDYETVMVNNDGIICVKLSSDAEKYGISYEIVKDMIISLP